MGYNLQFLNKQALNANITSSALQVVDGRLYSIQLAFTGSPCSFTAKLQVSTDPYNNAVGYTPPHWDDLSDGSATVLSAGTTSFIVGQQYTGYVWIRVVITDNSSGSNTGVVSANINVKN